MRRTEPESDAEPVLDSTVSLGEIDPARSRHRWRRSGIIVHDELVVVGTWGGDVRAFDVGTVADERDTPITERWTHSFDDSPVTVASVGERADGGAIAVGCRGDDGTIALLDRVDGSVRWSYEGSIDVGTPNTDSVFYWPYVVGLVVDEANDGVYAAVRRYERTGEDRRWHSVILAFDVEGEVRWRYEADASPIAIDLAPGGDRLAVGYNRCFGDHQEGLVVLDAASGTVDWTWDPNVEGDRRVGDVCFDSTGDTLGVTSHGDFRGYLFAADGDGVVDGDSVSDNVARDVDPLWMTDLATETEIEGQTCYAYPNHVYVHDGRVAFVTGNTYARESRETAGPHPNEHTVFGYDADGQRRWQADSDGFVHELATTGSTVVLPTAQHFRVRDPETHSVRTIDLETGSVDVAPAAGIVTGAATDGARVAAIEEPIEYHDEGCVRGSYTLHVGSLVDDC